jgi:hypothetical protein
MRVTLLQTEGCVHGAETERVLREALAAIAPAAALGVTTLTSTAQPEMSQFSGSPTILVDGVDLEPDATSISGFG